MWRGLLGRLLEVSRCEKNNAIDSLHHLLLRDHELERYHKFHEYFSKMEIEHEGNHRPKRTITS